MLLLDTHVFLWFILADPKLPSEMKVAIENHASEVCLSVVSVWELVIKQGKLDLPESPTLFALKQCNLHSFRLLTIEVGALEMLERLPSIHRDPFDRLILAQSLQHQCQVLTVDPEMLRYPGISFFV
jgi:PIN domain nuclease of toxin-antitoxin system